MNILESIIKYENGTMDDSEMIELFQELVNNGMAWSLQGHYGRVATGLIHEGIVTRAKPDIVIDEKDLS
jgi:hypothetical protein